MNDVKRRYMNDPVFHAVVDQLRGILRSAMLAPSEVREAAMLACIIEDEYNPRPPLSTSDVEMEIMRERLRT